MKFRNEMDKWHYFGSMSLSVIGLFFFAWLLGLKTDAPAWNCWVLGYVLGFVTANILGIIMELLEHFVFPSWKNDVYWRDKPEWMRKYLSGDKWDGVDISLNFSGSTLIHPAIMLLKDLRSSK